MMMGYRRESSENSTLLAMPVNIKGRSKMLKVIRDSMERHELGMSGAPLFGNLVAIKPTNPMRNVFPIDDDAAATIDSKGGDICLYFSIQL